MDLGDVRWRKASYSSNDASCVEVGVWRKASRSNDSANCVEVGAARGADEGAVCLVRDTKDRGGPSLAFTAGEWAAFVAGVKAGESGRAA
jgi:Domain of unknown function (DUF397)